MINLTRFKSVCWELTIATFEVAWGQTWQSITVVSSLATHRSAFSGTIHQVIMRFIKLASFTELFFTQSHVWSENHRFSRSCSLSFTWHLEWAACACKSAKWVISISLCWLSWLGWLCWLSLRRCLLAYRFGLCSVVRLWHGRRHRHVGLLLRHSVRRLTTRVRLVREAWILDLLLLRHHVWLLTTIRHWHLVVVLAIIIVIVVILAEVVPLVVASSSILLMLVVEIVVLLTVPLSLEVVLMLLVVLELLLRHWLVILHFMLKTLLILTALEAWRVRRTEWLAHWHLLWIVLRLKIATHIERRSCWLRSKIRLEFCDLRLHCRRGKGVSCLDWLCFLLRRSRILLHWCRCRCWLDGLGNIIASRWSRLMNASLCHDLHGACWLLRVRS